MINGMIRLIAEGCLSFSKEEVRMERFWLLHVRGSWIPWGWRNIQIPKSLNEYESCCHLKLRKYVSSRPFDCVCTLTLLTTERMVRREICLLSSVCLESLLSLPSFSRSWSKDSSRYCLSINRIHVTVILIPCLLYERETCHPWNNSLFWCNDDKD
jgi:hypothetical protein